MALLTSMLAHNVTRAERELEVKSEHLADLQVVVIQCDSPALTECKLTVLLIKVHALNGGPTRRRPRAAIFR